MKKSILRSGAALLLFCLLLFAFAGLTACGRKAEKRDVYTIAALFDEENMALSGELGLEYRNRTETEITALEFNLFGRAYREGAKVPFLHPSSVAAAYPAGVDYGDMTVGDVTDGAGNALSSEITGEDENILRVTLSEGIFPGETCTVRIPFRVELAHIRHRLGYTERAINLGNWYPVLCARTEAGWYECVYSANGDPFFSECADYRVTFTCPEKYVLASSGRQTAKERTGEGVTYTMALDNARDFAMALSDKFEVITENTGDFTLSYYYYDDARAADSFRAAKDSMNYFSGVFSDYPHETMSVVQTPFNAGGMEYPGLVYISDAVSGAEIDTVIVHENAHQWWYGIVGNNQLDHAWMDEGLAEYSVALFYENNSGYGITREMMAEAAERSFRASVKVYRKLLGEADTTMNRNLRAFLSEYEYVNIAYNKGFLLFDALRESVGIKRFLSGLKKYAGEYAGKIARPEDLASCFTKVGADTDAFFESWIEGKVSFEN